MYNEIHFMEVGNVDDGALYGVTVGRTGMLTSFFLLTCTGALL